MNDSVIFILPLAVYLLLLRYETVVVKRLNWFYVILYMPFRSAICIKIHPACKSIKLPVAEQARMLNRSTASLYKCIPPGKYKAYTHERVLEGLQHMQDKGRAKIISCKKKGRPRSLAKEYRYALGRGYNTLELPKVQRYTVKFNILP